MTSLHLFLFFTPFSVTLASCMPALSTVVCLLFTLPSLLSVLLLHLQLPPPEIPSIPHLRRSDSPLIYFYVQIHSANNKSTNYEQEYMFRYPKPQTQRVLVVAIYFIPAPIRPQHAAILKSSPTKRQHKIKATIKMGELSKGIEMTQV